MPTLPGGATELWLVPLVTLAFLVQAVTGFGSTVLALVFGTWLLPVEALVPVMLLVDLPLAGWLAWRDRARIDRQVLLGTVTPWMGAGVAVGSSLAAWVGGEGMRRGYGVLIVALVGRELLGGAPARSIGATRAWTFGAGVVHGLWGSGGPLLVQATRPLLPDRTTFRATMCAVWVVFDALVLATCVARSELDGAALGRALLVAPAIPLGLWLGDHLHHRLPESVFTGVVRGLLVVGGTSMALR